MGQYGRKSDMPNHVCWKSPNFNKNYELVYGIHGKIYLWHYVNSAVLWMNMEEHRK